MADIQLLTWEQVMGIHQDQLRLFGGQDGFIDEGVVRSAVAQPEFLMMYCDPPADLADLAAAYLFAIASTQGFMDGNKRTGANCSATFLGLNGYLINATNMELYNLTMQVANHEIDREVVANWLRDHLIPRE